MNQTPERKEKKEYCGKTTIRILKEKEWVYDGIRKVVMKDLHSDLCYFTVSLWEAFLQGWKQVPNSEDPFVMKFLRQNIQFNMGCNFNYIVKKSRRKPSVIGDPLLTPRVELRKNLFFPLLLEEWGTLSEEKKRFWLQRLIEAGIIPPDSEKTQQHKKSESMEQCMAFDGKQWILSFLRWLVTPLW